MNKRLQLLYLNFPYSLRNILKSVQLDLEEIRLRIGKPLMMYDGMGEWFVDAFGKVSKNDKDVYIVSRDDVDQCVELISKSSIYTVKEDLKNGFITVEGGHRIGVAGSGVVFDGKLTYIKEISSLNIRVAKEIVGAADAVMPAIMNNGVANTLIISPPMCGKTTLLRDIARQLSDKYRVKVGIVDERSEIAACYKGVSTNNVGMRTDILNGCPKAEGMIMMIRSMSPQVLVTDEIGLKQDVDALKHVFNAGVKVITSIHGYGVDDIRCSQLIGEGFFSLVFILSSVRGKFEKIVVGK